MSESDAGEHGRAASRHRAALRLFVAAYPPRNVAEALLARLARLPDSAKRTGAEQVHLTLYFAGDRPSHALGAVCESVMRACAGIGPVRARVKGLVLLPEKTPRLVAAELEECGVLRELHDRLQRRLAGEGRGRGERFLPHMTLARFGPMGAAGWTPESSAESTEFLVPSVALVKSVLRPEGARHIVVQEFPLLG